MEDTILHGDVYAALDWLENSSVAVAITSPPYWKQRDYGFPTQIGQESTPEEYIGRLVKIFSKLREKLKEDGVFFLNVGDKYLNRYGKSHLLQIPYRLAYHMIKDGWNLLDIIIWYKPNHMPSSAKDRFTNTYEPVMVFSKGPDSIYRGGSSVVKIPLQQTPWRHTAVFPEDLVSEMLRRTNIMSGDIVLDPFAGTGTVGAVVKRIRESIPSKEIYSVMVERGDSFVRIIEERTEIKRIIKLEDIPYDWSPVEEEPLPEVDPSPIMTDKHGEVFIAEESRGFLQALRGLSEEDFKNYHREDALYFFGVKNWSIDDLYYISRIFELEYVLRNMIVVAREGNWFPIFMFAHDSTRVAYKFYLDRVRIRPKSLDNPDWWREDFVGLRVRDISGKVRKEGRVAHILKRYEDGFPKILVIDWGENTSVEFALHPDSDEFIMEGLVFECPRCGAELKDPYDPVGTNSCPNCGLELWTELDTLPRIVEPIEVLEAMNELRNVEFTEDVRTEPNTVRGRKNTSSKFLSLDRMNWGASPGARKLILGNYFSKMRLYRIDQPAVAKYLTILRKHLNLSIRDVISYFPGEYEHTVGHWFRQDFGGSIPLPEDVEILKKILNVNTNLFDVLKRTALKFQTVKASRKGKNPGDFIEGLDDRELISYLRKLYQPPLEYVRGLDNPASRH